MVMQDKSSMLHDAAASKSVEAVQQLLAKGASVDAKDKVCTSNLKHLSRHTYGR